MYKTFGVLAAFGLLAACGAPKPRQPLPERTGPEAVSNAPYPRGPGIYRIEPSRSELRLLVHRAGPMARLGHNHVIVNRSIGGWVHDAGNPAAAAVFLSLPVADFVVDDARVRGEEGPDFSEEVPEAAKLGTRHNMLSDALLDGDRFPVITVASVAVTQGPGMPSATLILRLAGRQTTLVVPFALEVSPGRISASGTLTIRQSAMGLVPFSVMLGALQVQDELTIKFKFVALAT